MKRFLSFLATGALALGLTASASAQTRPIGAGSIVLDDGTGDGNTLTLAPPTLSCNSTYIFPSVCGTFTLGAIPPGTINGQLIYWNSTDNQWETINAPGTNGDVLTSGTGNVPPTWAASSSGLSGGTVNQIPIWSTPTSLGNSSIADDGTTVSTGENFSANDLQLPNSYTLSSPATDDLSLTSIDNTFNLHLNTDNIGAGAGAFNVYLDGNATAAMAVTTANTSISSLSTNGVVHATGSNGTLASSLIVNSDITNSTINLTQKVTGTLPVANGGTGDATLTTGDLLLGNGTSAVTAGPAWNGTTLTGNISGNAGGTAANVTGTVVVANGGTGDVTLTSGDLLLGNGTSAVTAGPAWNGSTLTGNISGNAGGTAANVTGTVVVANGGTGDVTLTSGDLLLGNGTSAVTAGPAWNGTTLTGNISGTASNVTGTVAVANGGTGDVTLTSGDLLLGNGTSAVTAGPAWNGTTLTGNISGTASNVTGTVAVANGGTGDVTLTSGDLLLGNGTSAVTAGPAWNGTTLTGNISGTASNVTGTVAVANGGTGDVTLTSGDLLLGNGTSAVTAGPAWNGTTLTGNISGNAGGTASNVTGTVAIANGGTGQTTASGAINALLPSQGGNLGDVLTTNGTTASWGAPGGGGLTSHFTAVTTTESRASTNTYAADGYMTLSVPAGATEVISGTIYALSTSAAPGIKFEMVSSQNSNMAVYMQAREDGGANAGSAILSVTGGTTSTALTGVTMAANTVTAIQVSGYVTNTQATATTFTVYWAQNASNATATTVEATSYLTWTQY